MIDSATSSIPSTAATPARVLSRVAAALLGGWVFTWGFVALGIVALLAAGMGFDDARSLLHLLAFLLFLAVVIWAFATASVLRVWLVLVGGGALMTAAAWFMSRSGV